MKKYKKKVIPLLYPTYLAIIKNSIGSHMFRNSFAKVNGKKKDILENGELSCAFFVSFILKSFDFNLIKHTHAMTDGLIRDMEQQDWKIIKKPKIGAVLVWEEKLSKNGNITPHIGFYIGNKKAISHRDTKKTPIMHHFTYGTKNGKPIRKIIHIFWHDTFKK